MLIFILILVHLAWFLITKPKHGYFYCGLWGLCSNREIDEAMLDKLKMLGFFNQARGTDSCGYFNGEDIVKGVDSKKEWHEFVVDNKVRLAESGSKVFIGHTRKSTFGAHTEANAHPFDINGRLVVAHNGTIDNAFTLCTQNGIPVKDINVDSQGLGFLIEKLGWDALKKYKGAAALLIYDREKPDSLFVFHGWSKKWRTMEAEEERPLYYLLAEEGVYFSSIRAALEWINKGKSAEKIKVVPHNTVFEICAGEGKPKEAVHIEREWANVESEVAVSVYPKRYTDYEVEKYKPKPLLPAKKVDTVYTPIYIQRESIPDKYDKKVPGVFYWKGRYWTTYDMQLCNGPLTVNKRGEIVGMNDLHQTRVANCFFYMGVMLASEEKYRYINNELGSENTTLYMQLMTPDQNFAMYISNYSKYPVCNIDDEACKIYINREKWYLGGVFAHAKAIQPVFGDRIYHFVNGACVKITGRKEDEPYITEKRSEAKKQEAATIVPFWGGTGKELPFPPLGTALIKPLSVKSEPAVHDIPEEVLEYYRLFKTVFVTETEAKERLTSVASDALENYAEDLIKLIMREDPTDELVEKIMKETIHTAVLRSETLSDVMDTGLQTAMNYIYDAYEEWLEDQESEEETEEIEVVDLMKEQEASMGAENAPDSVTDKDVRTLFNMSSPNAEMYESEDGGINFKSLEELENENISENEDTEEALQRMDLVIQYMSCLKRDSEKLAVLGKSNLALDLAHELTMFIDVTAVQLKEVSAKHKQTLLTSKLSKIQSIF